jgi:hypothetical protein
MMACKEQVFKIPKLIGNVYVACSTPWIYFEDTLHLLMWFPNIKNGTLHLKLSNVTLLVSNMHFIKMKYVEVIRLH